MQDKPNPQAKDSFYISMVLVLLVGVAGCTSEFQYIIVVFDSQTGESIAYAEVMIEVPGRIHLNAVTDITGTARVMIPASYAGKPGRLRIEASGYRPYRKEIDLHEGILPEQVLLDQTSPVTPTPGPALAPMSTPTKVRTGTLTPTQDPTLSGSTWTRPADGMVMVYAPGGEFEMGSSQDEVNYALQLCKAYNDPGEGGVFFEDELLAHTVALDSFWIDRTEVTNGQYRRCVEAGVCQAPTTCDWGEPTYGDTSKRDHPVVCVSWQAAQTYCEWVGARLPTEAEWEYAACGPEEKVFPWGDVFDGKRLNYCDVNCGFADRADRTVNDGYVRTAPVGSYLDGASWCGALDMAGNVWEWTADWYNSDYYGSSPSQDPTGPLEGDYRVLRGGSCYAFPRDARAADRNKETPGLRNQNVGFRCAGMPGE